MSCLLLSQNIVFCKSSLLCKLWALLGHGARIAHQERSLTTNLNAANNYKAASCFWGWGWSQEQDGFFGGWIHGFCNGFVLFCFACFSALLLLGLFSIIYLDRHYGSFYSSANKVDGWINILPQKTRRMGCTDAPVISGGSSEGKHGHPVSCKNCLQRWILHHRVTRIYGDAWCSKSPDSADSCWGGLSRQAPDRVMGETAPMVLMVEKMWLLIW